MKFLLSRSGSFLTGTAIADAVVAYAVALIAKRQVALVDIPVVDGKGALRRWALPVGWYLETSAVTADVREDGEIVDADTTAHLGRLTAGLGIPHGEAFDDQDLRALQWAGYDRLLEY